MEARRVMAAAIDHLSDEFEDSTSISEWQRVHQAEGWNADQLQVWDVDQSQSGRMVITWNQT